MDDLIKFCPNSCFRDNEVETLKVIFNNCQQLERINILCSNLKEKEMLEIVTNIHWKVFMN